MPHRRMGLRANGGHRSAWQARELRGLNRTAGSDFASGTIRKAFAGPQEPQDTLVGFRNEENENHRRNLMTAGLAGSDESGAPVQGRVDGRVRRQLPQLPHPATNGMTQRSGLASLLTVLAVLGGLLGTPHRSEIEGIGGRHMAVPGCGEPNRNEGRNPADTQVAGPDGWTARSGSRFMFGQLTNCPNFVLPSPRLWSCRNSPPSPMIRRSFYGFLAAVENKGHLPWLSTTLNNEATALPLGEKR